MPAAVTSRSGRGLIGGRRGLGRGDHLGPALVDGPTGPTEVEQAALRVREVGGERRDPGVDLVGELALLGEQLVLGVAGGGGDLLVEGVDRGLELVDLALDGVDLVLGLGHRRLDLAGPIALAHLDVGPGVGVGQLGGRVGTTGGGGDLGHPALPDEGHADLGLPVDPEDVGGALAHAGGREDLQLGVDGRRVVEGRAGGGVGPRGRLEDDLGGGGVGGAAEQVDAEGHDHDPHGHRGDQPAAPPQRRVDGASLAGLVG